MRHRADLHQHHQVAHVEALDDFLDQALLHGGRAARDHVTLLHEVLVAERLGIFRAPHRVAVGREQAPVVLVTRRGEPLRRHVQALVVEVLDVLRVVGFRLRVRLGHRDELQEARAIRIALEPLLVHHVPVAVHHGGGGTGARVGEEAVADIVLGGEVEGADAARAGHPDRRVRLLHRPWPEVDLAELEVLPVPREDFLRLPRLQHELEGLAIPLAVLHRGDAVGEVDVHRAAERQPRDEPPTADAVEHAVLLGYPDRRRGGRQGHAHLDDGHVEAVGLLGQHAAHQVGARHEPVGVLVMLVGAYPVEPRPGRVQQLVERPVVVLAHTPGVGQLPPGRGHPDARVAPLEIGGQLAVGHQVERADFHGGSISLPTRLGAA